MNDIDAIAAVGYLVFGSFAVLAALFCGVEAWRRSGLMLLHVIVFAWACLYSTAIVKLAVIGPAWLMQPAYVGSVLILAGITSLLAFVKAKAFITKPILKRKVGWKT